MKKRREVEEDERGATNGMGMREKRRAFINGGTTQEGGARKEKNGS